MDERTVKTLDLVVGIVSLLLYLGCCSVMGLGAVGMAAIGGIAAASTDPAAQDAAAAAATIGTMGTAIMGALALISLVGVIGSIGTIMQRKWGFSILMIMGALQLLIGLASFATAAPSPWSLIFVLGGVYALMRLYGKLGERPM